MATKSPGDFASTRRGGPTIIRPSRPGSAKAARPTPSARPRKSAARSKSGGYSSLSPFAAKVRAVLVVTALLVIAMIVLGLGVRAIASSSIFAIKSVQIVGNQLASEDEIRRLTNKAIRNRSLLEIDLSVVRREVETSPLIRRATVTRIIPDSLRVTVEERQPVALARKQTGDYVWLSADAVEIGDSNMFHPVPLPPLLLGVTDSERQGQGLPENRDRVQLFQKIVNDLGADKAAVEEIDLSSIDPLQVGFHLKDSRITVQVGKQDFHQRLKSALAVINAARQGDSGRLSELHVSNISELIQKSSLISCVYANPRLTITFAGSPMAPGRGSQVSGGGSGGSSPVKKGRK